MARVSRIVTLGDSVLDSGRYSGGPGTSAPELVAAELGSELVPLARDGHTVRAALDFQLRSLPEPAPGTALVVSVGGNDLLYDLARGWGRLDDFARGHGELVARAQRALAPERTLVANIYDPTGHDPGFAKWIPDVEAALAVHARFNEAIAATASKHGATLVDLCAAFRQTWSGPPWITCRIEPSAAGAKEIARLFVKALTDGVE